MKYLLAQLKMSSGTGYRGKKTDIFSIIVDLYNHNMIQPKFYMDYNNFILYNSNYVESFDRGIVGQKMRSDKRVKYDIKAMAELFQKTFIDNDAFLSKPFRFKIIFSFKFVFVIA